MEQAEGPDVEGAAAEVDPAPGPDTSHRRKGLACHSGTGRLRRGIANCELGSFSALGARKMEGLRQLDVVQATPELVPPRPEGRQAGVRDGFVADAFERQRLDPAVAVLHPIVEVRSAGDARGAGESDSVALPHV